MTDIVSVSDLDPNAVRGVISLAFGPARSAAWWQWKHVDGPWGRSSGLAVVEAGAIVSVRLLLPWALHHNGREHRVERAIDAATVPEGQGRGLFSVLNEALMEERRAAGRWTAIFSTPNESSRNAYQRLGWRWLEPISHRYGLVVPSLRARFEEVDPASIVPDTPPPGRVGTAWDDASWRWRTDPRCGETYLGAKGSDAAVVYRVIRRSGQRIVLVLAATGALRARRSLLGGVLRQRRAAAILEPMGPGAAQPVARTGLRRGESLLAVWESHPGHVDSAPVSDRSAWWCQLADVERVL